MSVLSDQILQLQQKQQQLLKHYSKLKKENVQLKKALFKKENQLNSTEEHLKELQHNFDVLKLSKGSFDENEKLALETRLTDYIKEIDRCLKLLNT